MKKSSPIRASHVNDGTALPEEDRPRSVTTKPAFRAPTLTPAVDASDVTEIGGLSLALRLLVKLRVPQRINRALSLLRVHRGYFESDHVLTHACNLFAGGTCLEDIGHLQHSEPIRRLLGTEHIPDPTTAGDFLRRFDASDVDRLDRVIDEVQQDVWKLSHGRKKQAEVLIDVDSHVHHVYGHQMEGCDYTYKGGFGYHPLVLSIAGTQECLRIINRPGNFVSSTGTEDALEDVLPLLKRRFKRIVIRGDSAFAKGPIFKKCEEHGAFFAVVSPEHQNFHGLAENIAEEDWEEFRQHERMLPVEDQPATRKRGEDVRRERTEARGKRDLRLQEQSIAEIPYRPARSKNTYRLIIRRQRINEHKQGQLFEKWRYRYVLTNLPRSVSTRKAIDMTYQRCDQEKVIEQLKNGVSAMSMPTGGFLANHAYMVCARLAHNLKAWLAQIALPRETMRWEWKRFRRSFVQIAARVTLSGRRTNVHLAKSHRFAFEIQKAIAILQT